MFTDDDALDVVNRPTPPMVQRVDEPLIGTATWMEPPLVNQVYPYEEGAIWLGRNGDDAKTAVGRKHESHVLLCAMNRSGKGRALITNNLLLWKGSVVCNDPKGENASVCAARRGQGSKHVTKPMGQKVFVLDGHGAAKVQDQYRGYYNVLNELDPNDPDCWSKAGDIAEAMITDTVRDDQTWNDMAKPYMQALLVHIVSAPVSRHENDGEIPADQRDLVTFRRFIQRGDFFAEAYLKARRSPEELRANPPEKHRMLLEAMEANKSLGELISDEAESLLESLTIHERLFNSIRSAALTATAWISDPQMRDVLRAGKHTRTFRAIDLEIDPDGVSVFVCLRLKDQKKMAAWPRLVMNMVLSAAEDDYHRTPATGHNTLMMFDEFASLERMQKVQDAASAISGAGIKLFLVLQDLVQMKTVYGDAFETFVANAGTHICYGFNDNFTAEYYSKRLGEIEVIRKLRSGSSALAMGDSISNMEGGGKAFTKNRQRTRNQQRVTGKGGGTAHNSNYGTSSNVTYGWNPSLLHLSLITSKQLGNGRNKQHGTSRQDSWNESTAYGSSDSYGSGETTNENWARTVTQQRTQTDTAGWSEQLHKKPLAAINELIDLFGEVEDETAPNYPGIGLVSVAGNGKPPALIVKCFYDQDPFFEGMFDPHPKHGISKKAEARTEAICELELVAPDYRAHFSPVADADASGGFFQKGEVISHAGFHGNSLHKAETIDVVAPCDCWVGFYERVRENGYKVMRIEAHKEIEKDAFSYIQEFSDGMASHQSALEEFKRDQKSLKDDTHAIFRYVYWGILIAVPVLAYEGLSLFGFVIPLAIAALIVAFFVERTIEIRDETANSDFLKNSMEQKNRILEHANESAKRETLEA